MCHLVTLVTPELIRAQTAATDKTTETAPYSATLLAFHCRTTDGTAIGKNYVPRVIWSTLAYNGYDLGNNVACATNNYRVTDAQLQTLYFIGIVQCCIADRDATDKDRLQPGHGGNRTGTAHLEFHVQ